MKRRNIYKDIVWLAVICAVVFSAVRWSGAYAMEQKAYGVQIQAQKDLTGEMVSELRKLSGICRFLPTDTAAVTIQIGTYVMETEVMGVDLTEYPLQWEALAGASDKPGASGKWRVSMGNTPLLFFGKETFSSFVDSNGRAPLKSQEKKKKKEYQKLEVTVTDENGTKRTAKICGILLRPDNQICMEKRQMQEVFGGCFRTAGGLLEIYGYKNMEKARGLLEDAGFAVLDF